MIDTKQYSNDGYATSALLNPEEVKKYYAALTFWDLRLDFMKSDYRCKSHVLFRWAYELSMNMNVRNCVSQILGNGYDCWDMMLWIKPVGVKRGISPHQDAIYQNWWPKAETVSVFIGLSPLTTEETAPVRVYAGSHLFGLQLHEDMPSPSNMLMRGQTTTTKLGTGVDVQLKAGEGIFLHPLTVHGGPPEVTPNDLQDRIGVELIYVSDMARPILMKGLESATCNTGRNPFLTYDPAPQVDFGDYEKKVWRRAYDEQHANYYKMKYEMREELS